MRIMNSEPLHHYFGSLNIESEGRKIIALVVYSKLEFFKSLVITKMGLYKIVLNYYTEIIEKNFRTDPYKNPHACVCV